MGSGARVLEGSVTGEAPITLAVVGALRFPRWR